MNSGLNPNVSLNFVDQTTNTVKQKMNIESKHLQVDKKGR